MDMTKEYVEKMAKTLEITIHDVAVAMAWGYSWNLQQVLGDLLEIQRAVREWIWKPTQEPLETWADREDVIRRAMQLLGA